METYKSGRKLYEITCANCRTVAFVPIQPISGNNYFCRKCWTEIKQRMGL